MSGEGATGTDRQKMVDGIDDPSNQARVSAQISTSLDDLKGDVGNLPALRKTSVSSAVHEEYYEDVQVEDDDYFEPRGRSRSRTLRQQSHDGSHSYEDEYVRVSTSASRSRPLSLFDRLTGSRSRSRSRKSNSFEEERIRITVRSREPSPLRYARHEEEYEERLEGSYRSPWRRGSETMLVHHSSEMETRRGGNFGRPYSTYSERLDEDRRLEGRLMGYRSPGRTMRSLRGHSPEPILRRRRSSDHGFGRRPRVRFARSTSSHHEEHREPHGQRRRYRHGSEVSFSDEEEFHSTGSTDVLQKADFESMASDTFDLRPLRLFAMSPTVAPLRVVLIMTTMASVESSTVVISRRHWNLIHTCGEEVNQENTAIHTTVASRTSRGDGLAEDE
ncbi:MAG: hypothetical protein Q9209_002534 [Squamulea sp. 1 TL-2023]